jgi:hypothetical protein
MKLRDHPLLSYHGATSWPPTWLWGGGVRYAQAAGEVGVLKDIVLSGFEPCERCFLFMEREGRRYIGTLFFEDASFCQKIYAVLMEERGKTIQEIGEIDIPLDS